jgi:hypothetical protein
MLHDLPLADEVGGWIRQWIRAEVAPARVRGLPYAYLKAAGAEVLQPSLEDSTRKIHIYSPSGEYIW